jgi:hypothetical protein
MQPLTPPPKPATFAEMFAIINPDTPMMPGDEESAMHNDVRVALQASKKDHHAKLLEWLAKVPFSVTSDPPAKDYLPAADQWLADHPDKKSFAECPADEVKQYKRAFKVQEDAWYELLQAWCEKLYESNEANMLSPTDPKPEKEFKSVQHLWKHGHPEGPEWKYATPTDQNECKAAFKVYEEKFKSAMAEWLAQNPLEAERIKQENASKRARKTPAAALGEEEEITYKTCLRMAKAMTTVFEKALSS